MGAAFVPFAGTGSVWRGFRVFMVFPCVEDRPPLFPPWTQGDFSLLRGRGSWRCGERQSLLLFPLPGKRLRSVQVPGADSRFSSFPEEEEVGPGAALWRRSGFPW